MKETVRRRLLRLMSLTKVVSISATLPHEILEMINKFMTAPLRILVNGGEMTLEEEHNIHSHKLPLIKHVGRPDTDRLPDVRRAGEELKKKLKGVYCLTDLFLHLPSSENSDDSFKDKQTELHGTSQKAHAQS